MLLGANEFPWRRQKANRRSENSSSMDVRSNPAQAAGHESRHTRGALERKGHVFAQRAGNIGGAAGVMIDLKTGMKLGASDPRSGRRAGWVLNEGFVLKHP